MDRALDHGNVANPLQRGRRIRRGADDDQRLDHRLEPAHIAGDDEALDLGARRRDQQNQVVSEVDSAAERLPRVFRLQAGSTTPQRDLQTRELLADAAVLERRLEVAEGDDPVPGKRRGTFRIDAAELDETPEEPGNG